MLYSKIQKNPVNDEKAIENTTISSIYMYKIYNFLNNNTFGYIINRIFYTIISITIILILTYPGIGIEYFKKLFLFENMILPKSFVIFYIIFNIKTISEQYQLIMKKVMAKRLRAKKNTSEKDEDEIFGISIYELLNHLFEFKHFKRTEIEQKFLIPRNKYQILAAKMEEINILTRGENNSRILNEDFTREQIARAFVFAEGDIKKLHMPVQQIGNGFTREPLAQHIKENINLAAHTANA